MLTETEQAIKDTMAKEDPARGIWFAQEIHRLQQEKLILQTRRDLRKVRIRRMMLEDSDI